MFTSPNEAEGPRASVRPLAFVLLVTLGCLLPFVNKAFHIDDPLFLRAAAQIQQHPADFYGFTLNWLGTPLPMIKDFDNPPLACYYIALVALISGWSEPALHLAFLLPALAAAWGTFALARRFCARPHVAALAGVLTPVFLISATTLMCDMMLLAFWAWAVVLFEHGLEKNAWAAFLGSGLLAGLAVLTKFTGFALVPLLGFYGLARQQRVGRWLITLLVPVLFAAAYEWITRRLYGQGMLLAAGVFASEDRSNAQGQHLEKWLLGLGFLGGCFLPVLFYLPLVWSRRMMVVWLCLLLPCVVLLPLQPHLKPFLAKAGLNWGMLFETALFVAVGILVLLLTAADFWRRRDPVALLLVLWVLGILVFATALNWTINGRSLLPSVPAVGILLARRLDLRRSAAQSEPLARFLWPALPAAALSLLPVMADYQLANTNRLAAAQLCAKYHRPGKGIWFEGHWGFQYYMEKLGAAPIDFNDFRKPSGDILIIPDNSSENYDPPADLIRRMGTVELIPSAYCATMNWSAGAGFYASVFGPLPFVVGHLDPDRFYVFEFR